MKRFTRIMLIMIATFLVIGQLSAQNILCVDRAFGDSTADPYTDPWPWFMESLDANGYTYEHFKVEDAANNGPDATYMSDFDIVIWFTGEAWTGSETMTIDDEFNLLLYQTLNGGHLFLSSQDYLWDRYQAYGTFTPGEFPYDQLGLVEVYQDVWNIAEDPDTARFNGAPGSIAEGLSFPVKDIFSGLPTDEGLFIDSIAQHNGQSLYTVVEPHTNDGNAGIQYQGETFRTIFSTISFAAITDVEARNEFLFRIVNYLMLGVGVNELSVEKSDILIHPNPATDLVTIGMVHKMKEVRIINSQGQVVFHQDINGLKARIDVSQFSTGIYIVQAITENGLATQKMVVE